MPKGVGVQIPPPARRNILIIERVEEYDSPHCWQYDIRLNNLEEDLRSVRMSASEAELLKVSDFDFKFVDDPDEREEIREFIKRHEWLGNLSQYTTHWFGCYYRGVLAGAILMNLPNAFSKLLGEDTPQLERLISRGACISWSPKNLASSFMMWSIKWMAVNTQYRLFTAYSDPSARELGTIYQACNFYYLGQSSGTTTRYINPYSGKVVSDRFFRQRTAYKKYAGEMGIKWQKNWTHPTGINWSNIPDDVEKMLRQASKDKQASSEKIVMPSKHKYAIIMGRDRKETKTLRKQFESRNKTYPYPKDRGV